ncbi:basic proline-rich protein-like isoform X1 [Cervus canadensis]|uniref:basic proline-rich protein-like isoform X1 n=1 Tax=Cervus canadensis TaxID=1574408 RepID=UPI001CA3382B|nr:basic proline-rich protein-like isoform X1 [Cervus canadensis]
MRTLAQTSGLSPQPGVYQGLPSLRRGAGARPPRAPPPTFLQLAAPLPPAPKKAGRRDGGREGADTEQSAGTHTHTLSLPPSPGRPHTHTLRGVLYPSAAPCSATPRDPPSPGPRPLYAAGPEAWRGGGWSPNGGQRRTGVAPPLRLAFFPAPPPLGRNYGGPGRGRLVHSCRIPPPPFPTPSPRAVGAAACAAPTRFGAAAREVGTPLFHSARTASGGKREKSCDPAPAKICMLLQNPLTISCPAGVLGLLGQPAVCLRLNTTGTKQGEEDCATLVQIDFHWQLWWCWNCC